MVERVSAALCCRESPVITTVIPSQPHTQTSCSTSLYGRHRHRSMQPLQPSADCSGKALECPVCRVETKVKGGQAGSLPKNFSLLG